MKKREKILLQILIVVVLLAVVWFFFLNPALTQNAKLRNEEEQARLRRTNMEQLIQETGLEKRIEVAEKLSEENYQFFYSVLNTYTIDEIINSLAKSNGLAVQSILIGDYEEAETDFPEVSGITEAGDGTAVTKDNNARLLKCRADISVSGSYLNILNYIDGLNAKSICLSINNLSISTNDRDATGQYSHNAKIGISIYGVNKMERVKPVSN